MRTRPSWDRHWMNGAHHAAEMSLCVKRQVGAVIVRGKFRVVDGFNGPPSGAEQRTEDTCVRIGVSTGTRPETVCCSHAEQNAINIAARLGARVEDCVMYVTTHPCAGCARSIVNAGIKEVVYEGSYDDAEAKEVFARSRVSVRWLPRPPAPERLDALDLID